MFLSLFKLIFLKVKEGTKIERKLNLKRLKNIRNYIFEEFTLIDRHSRIVGYDMDMGFLPKLFGYYNHIDTQK